MDEANGGDMMLTLRAEMKESIPEGTRNAILVQIYPPCLNVGVRYPMYDQSLVIGRGEECGLRISHKSVSRRHAGIKPTPEGYSVSDLGSTNGTLLNNKLVSCSPLKDGDYLRIGGCIFRFLTGSNLEAEYHEEIHRLTILDALTETHNKRYLLEYLERELSRAMRHQRPLSLVLFALDQFEQFNEGHGLLCGDHILREVADRTRFTIRKEDLLARWGRAEFALALPETSLEQSVALAERARALVGTEPFEYDGEVFSVSVSLGVTTTVESQPETVEELIRQAEEALDQARSAERNCVRVYTQDKAADALAAT